MVSVFGQYTTNFKRGSSEAQKVSYTGNNVKSMRISTEASLKKLRTSYIDILYLHWWDFDTSVEEVMNGLHILVQQGKVLYLVTLIQVRVISLPTFTRAFPIRLPGLCPRQTNTLAATGRHLSLFIKERGTLWSAPSNVTSFRWPALKVTRT
jgi:hypothetical protein